MVTKPHRRNESTHLLQLGGDVIETEVGSQCGSPMMLCGNSDGASRRRPSAAAAAARPAAAPATANAVTATASAAAAAAAASCSCCWQLPATTPGWRLLTDLEPERRTPVRTIAPPGGHARARGRTHLGVGQAQASHAAGAVGLGVDGAELLFDGAEVCHESVQVHVLALIQRLCRRGHIDAWEERGPRHGRRGGGRNAFQKVSDRWCCRWRTCRRSWPCWCLAWGELSAEAVPPGDFHPDSEQTHRVINF